MNFSKQALHFAKREFTFRIMELVYKDMLKKEGIWLYEYIICMIYSYILKYYQWSIINRIRHFGNPGFTERLRADRKMKSARGQVAAFEIQKSLR